MEVDPFGTHAVSASSAVAFNLLRMTNGILRTLTPYPGWRFRQTPDGIWHHELDELDPALGHPLRPGRHDRGWPKVASNG